MVCRVFVFGGTVEEGSGVMRNCGYSTNSPRPSHFGGLGATLGIRGRKFLRMLIAWREREKFFKMVKVMGGVKESFSGMFDRWLISGMIIT